MKNLTTEEYLMYLALGGECDSECRTCPISYDCLELGKGITQAAKDKLNELTPGLRPATNPAPMPECKPVAPEMVDHPAHYGGKDNPYEAIKVMEAIAPTEAFQWHCVLTATKYLHRWNAKGDSAENLKKAVWYIEKAIESLKKQGLNEVRCPKCGGEYIIDVSTRTKPNQGMCNDCEAVFQREENTDDVQ